MSGIEAVEILTTPFMKGYSSWSDDFRRRQATSTGSKRLAIRSLGTAISELHQYQIVSKTVTTGVVRIYETVPCAETDGIVPWITVFSCGELLRFRSTEYSWCYRSVCRAALPATKLDVSLTARFYLSKSGENGCGVYLMQCRTFCASGESWFDSNITIRIWQELLDLVSKAGWRTSCRWTLYRILTQRDVSRIRAECNRDAALLEMVINSPPAPFLRWVTHLN